MVGRCLLIPPGREPLGKTLPGAPTWEGPGSVPSTPSHLPPTSQVTPATEASMITDLILVSKQRHPYLKITHF